MHALKCSPGNTRVLCLLRLQTEIVHPTVVMVISDGAQVIAQADQLKLFAGSTVYAVDQARQDGVGLGLAFVKTVVERHQRDVGFTSKVVEGTTFSIALLAVTAQVPDVRAPLKFQRDSSMFSYDSGG